MNRSQNVTILTFGLVVVTLFALVGCTPVVALPQEGETAAALAEVESAPEAAKAWGPTYYRDDPSVLTSVPPLAIELRESPSYYRDDPALIQGMIEIDPAPEIRQSPSYYRDDPTLVGQH